jgi:hypothetical protein
VAVRKNLDLVWVWFYKDGAPTALNMKTITFVLLCLSLAIAVASAKDAHLIESQMLYNDAQGHVAYSIVYVLVPPNGQSPIVFKTFDSDVMEHTIGDVVRNGVLYYDASPIHSGGDILPTNAQIQSLQAYCKKSGIGFVISPTN